MVAESTLIMIKGESITGRRFDSHEHLKLELADYIRWINHIWLYSTLGYRASVEFGNACIYLFLPSGLLTIHFPQRTRCVVVLHGSNATILDVIEAAGYLWYNYKVCSVTFHNFLTHTEGG